MKTSLFDMNFTLPPKVLMTEGMKDMSPLPMPMQTLCLMTAAC